MKKIILLFLSLSFFPALAQWTQVNNGLGSLKIKGLIAVGNSLMATTEDQGIFVSTNLGDNWQVHPQNASLPNFNILFSEGDVFTYQGLIILGQGYYAGVGTSNIVVLPIQGIPNNNLSAWTHEEGSGIPEVDILGTAGGGLFWADNLASITWTEITGLPDANSKYITGLSIFNDPNSNAEYLLVGTRNGAYISSYPNSLASVSPKNEGLSGNGLYINKLYGNFALTQNGVYIFPDESGLSSGWQTLISTGDFRTITMDFFNQSFYFFGNQVGKVVIGDGSVINDVDLSGITGGAITSSFVYYPNSTPPGYIFVGTENGGVFRKQLSTTDVENNSIVVTEFKLNQNYPNPFNPSTKISWQSPVSGYTTLKVYDILGNEVATLVDEYRNAGSYEVEFPNVETSYASSLPTGVYFYKLQVGEFVQTKRMILAK
ncbi:Peptidase S8/S53 subtilisin kexin sedolisin [Ignavibacterium album JCM 16511]|uniref:Peptidase S8/S53 subtilisin kexin sedolisin n=1 Tax=Ignavibacterium album (strain DSM 19864 / JCM 16511 / NBRC 101810 / Mat9-16) TaxID=945713 RepID=I0AL56_IGNAJ|nr:T9SS type A sorting domain-containing protein [Ignavibacterium album]AFH49713.1 Peptidase S8/S53 subtilisin kexin sedolisin [Ignavibacterium album JCM 16511]